MKELREIHDWMKKTRRSFHAIPRVASLPDPTFVCEGRTMVSFSTNNYLGLAHTPRLINAARKGLEQYGVGNCESRLLGGDMDIYRDLEAKLAHLKGKDAALLFATGYLTNLGVLSALTTSGMVARVYGYRAPLRHKHVYFSDELNHVSIREGIRMSGAHKVTYRHCDMEDLARKMKRTDATCKIIASDAVFSMDGDIAPLPDMLRLAHEHDAMIYLDDAHGTGLLGETGAGTTEHFKLNSPRLICMGTLSKAYGAIGGFVAMDKHIAEILRFTASSYGFTSTIPPDQALAVAEAMAIVQDEPERRRRLWENQRYFVARMEGMGFRLISKQSCIVPVFIGDEPLCQHYAKVLESNGFHVDAIAFPGVKIGQARLRFNMNANHTREQIDRLLDVLGRQNKGGWK